jgi:hypothetical protein
MKKFMIGGEDLDEAALRKRPRIFYGEEDDFRYEQQPQQGSQSSTTINGERLLSSVLFSLQTPKPLTP